MINKYLLTYFFFFLLTFTLNIVAVGLENI